MIGEPNCNDVIGEDMVEFLMSGACKKKYREFLFRSYVETKKLQVLEEKLCQRRERLKFITEAWEQIAECRLVLKWTIAEKASPRKELFEYLQGEAEMALERLHDSAENTFK